MHTLLVFFDFSDSDPEETPIKIRRVEYSSDEWEASQELDRSELVT